MRAAAGLSELLRGCRKAGPAGLRGLLTSPPHLAGQASAALRGSFVNPCRGRRWGGCGAVFSNSSLDFCVDFFLIAALALCFLIRMVNLLLNSHQSGAELYGLPNVILSVSIKNEPNWPSQLLANSLQQIAVRFGSNSGRKSHSKHCYCFFFDSFGSDLSGSMGLGFFPGRG